MPFSCFRLVILSSPLLLIRLLLLLRRPQSTKYKNTPTHSMSMSSKNAWSGEFEETTNRKGWFFSSHCARILCLFLSVILLVVVLSWFFLLWCNGLSIPGLWLVNHVDHVCRSLFLFMHTHTHTQIDQTQFLVEILAGNFACGNWNPIDSFLSIFFYCMSKNLTFNEDFQFLIREIIQNIFLKSFIKIFYESCKIQFQNSISKLPNIC